MSIKGRTALRLTSVIAAGAVSMALMPALPAQALGNNRSVNRSCGVNYVASGRYSSTSAWAQTTKESGSCGSDLVAGLRASNGYTFPRVIGTEWSAFAKNDDNSGFGTGMHWGCDSCNVTYS